MNQTFMKEKPVFPLLLSMGIPMILSMMASSLYNIVDSIFVARISENAMTALSLVFPLQNLITAIGVGFSIGTNSVIARLLGAGRTKEAGEAATQGLLLSLLHGILIWLLGWLAVSHFLHMFTDESQTLRFGLQYSMIVFCFSPVVTAGISFEKLFQAVGRMVVSMACMLIGCIVNIILDPILIFGFRMGISGAALATVFSQLISFFLLLAGVHFSGCIPIRLKNVRFHRERLREIAGGGLPSLFRQGLGSVATMTLNIAANPYGDAAIAAMSVVSRIFMFAISALIGFGQGFQPVCGFNYGAKKYGRVREAFWFCVKVSTIFLFALSILGFLLSGHLIGIFRDDPEVIRIGTAAVRFQCATLILNGWIVMNNMMTQTMGKTFYASLLASARQGLFFIPILLILPRILGLIGIQSAQAAADLFAFLLSVVLYRKVTAELNAEEEKQTE